MFLSSLTRNMKGYNVARLNFLLSPEQYNLTSYYECRDPSKCWDLLYLAYLSSLNILAPFTTMSMVPSREPWITKECADKISERNKLQAELRYKEDKLLRTKFCEARNSARQLLNRAKSNFVQHSINANTTSPKKFWKGLKNLLPGKKQISKDSSNISLKN